MANRISKRSGEAEDNLAAEASAAKAEEAMAIDEDAADTEPAAPERDKDGATPTAVVSDATSGAASDDADATDAATGAPTTEAPAADAASDADATDAATGAAASGAAEGELARTLRLPFVVGVAVIALVVGLLIGTFALGSVSMSATVAGKTTVSEAELDNAMASYRVNGSQKTLTVRDVILQTSTLDAAQNAEGNYNVPSANSALGVIRNQVLLDAAEGAGITVTDDEVAAYVKETLGADNYEDLAAAYGMEADAVKTLARNSAIMAKLQESVVKDSAPDMPQPPDEPDSQDPDAATTASPAYARYIIQLAGDEWDADKDTWASEDGPFAQALAGTYNVSAKGATYEAAQQAYYVAYEAYAQATDQVSTQWNDFVNKMMGDVDIRLYTALI